MLFTAQMCFPCPINFRLKASGRQLTSSLICHNLVLAQTVSVRPWNIRLKIAY